MKTLEEKIEEIKKDRKLFAELKALLRRWEEEKPTRAVQTWKDEWR